MPSSEMVGSGSTSTKPSWDGAISIAMDYHQAYIKAVEDWSRFQKKRGDKMQLWNTIRKLLAKSANTDGISTTELYRAIGVKQYHGDSWDVSKGLYAALELEKTSSKDGDGSSKKDTEPTMSELAEQAGTVNNGTSIDNEFIKFGREVVTRRAKVEVAATELVEFMKFGVAKDDDSKSFEGSGIAEKNRAELSQQNIFYTEFINYDLADQIVIAKELTFGLSQSQRGKEFLANLFEYQYLSIFDPFAFTKVVHFREGQFNYTGQRAIDKGEQAYRSVFTKDPKAYIENHLVKDSGGHYRYDITGDKQSDSVAQNLSQLLVQLYGGLTHFHASRTKDSIYMGNVVDGETTPTIDTSKPNPDPDTVVTEFIGATVGAFLNDGHIQSAIDEIDWSKTSFEEPTWSEVFQGGADAGQWTSKETKYLAKISITTTDGLASDCFSSNVALAPRLLLVTASGMATYFSMSDSSQADFGDVHSIGKALNGLTELERYIPEETSGALYTSKRTLQVLSTVGVCLDAILIGVYAEDAAEEMQRGDYDAAAGYALGGLSGIAGIGSWGVGLAAGAQGLGTSVGMTLSMATGGLALVAFALGVLGALVVAWCDESSVTEWARKTYFGTGWDALTEQQLLNPENQWFRYKKLTGEQNPTFAGPDFVRQISELHSMVRPIGLGLAATGTYTRSGHSGTYPSGNLVLQPYDRGVWSKKSDVDIVEDGMLFVRPVRSMKNDAGFSLTNDVDGEYTHRISLRDKPGDTDLESKLLVRTVEAWATEKKGSAAHGNFLGFIEWVESALPPDSGLELVIREVEGVRNQRGEQTVTKWWGQFWDMSNDGSDLLGWTPGDIKGTVDTTDKSYDKQYLEILYVPPDVAAAMRQGKATIRPQDQPTVTRERIEIKDMSDVNDANLGTGWEEK